MKYKTERPTVGAIIVCAGKGERTGLAYNKVLHMLGQKTVLEHVLDAFTEYGVSHIIAVVAPADRENISRLLADYENVSVTDGGDTRAQSVLNGLRACDCDIAVIHDGARPFVDKELISRAVRSATEYGSGIAAVPTVDTVKRMDANNNVHSLPRTELYNTQTPQAFDCAQITDAYERIGTDNITDDAEAYERAGYSPRLVEGDYSNIKITTTADLFRISPVNNKIGVGYDVHRLVEGRPLILGGMHIEYEKGLLGHSDADVLTHAVMDALLSAAELPDIGVLFPDTDASLNGISSLKLLDNVLNELRERSLEIVNVSAVVIAQKPKLSPVIKDIRASLAAALCISIERVNVSATTTEGLGIVGDGNAIAATASCILTERVKK